MLKGGTARSPSKLSAGKAMSSLSTYSCYANCGWSFWASKGNPWVYWDGLGCSEALVFLCAMSAVTAVSSAVTAVSIAVTAVSTAVTAVSIAVTGR